jgi:hypothetical protein
MSVEGWLGLVGTIIGFALSYYLYVKTIKAKRLAYAYTQPVSLQLPLDDVPSEYLHDANEPSRDANDPSRVLMLLWNRGTVPIERSDFVQPIKVRPTDSVLRILVHEQDGAAAATVDDADKDISIELLRPKEAIIFLIDAMDADFSPEIKIVMKSADMSEFLRSAPVAIRDIIGIVIAIVTFLLVSWVFIVTHLMLPSEVWKVIQPLHLFLAFGLAYLMYKFVRRVLQWGTFDLPAKFFQLKKTCSEINRSWKSLQEESQKLMIKG